MQDIHNKLIFEIHILQDLMIKRAKMKASRQGHGEFGQNIYMGIVTQCEPYITISDIKAQLSAPFPKKIDLNSIYQVKKDFHQSLTHHRSEDFHPNAWSCCIINKCYQTPYWLHHK